MAPRLDASQCVSPACEQAASSPCVMAASAHLTPSAWRDIPSSWRHVAAAWQLVDIVRTNCWPSCTCLQPHRPLTPCLKAQEAHVHVKRVADRFLQGHFERTWRKQHWRNWQIDQNKTRNWNITFSVVFMISMYMHMDMYSDVYISTRSNRCGGLCKLINGIMSGSCTSRWCHTSRKLRFAIFSLNTRHLNYIHQGLNAPIRQQQSQQTQANCSLPAALINRHVFELLFVLLFLDLAPGYVRCQ